RERDSSEAERAQHLQKIHDLQEHVQEKERQFLDLQEQTGTNSDDQERIQPNGKGCISILHVMEDQLELVEGAALLAIQVFTKMERHKLHLHRKEKIRFHSIGR
ncbi:hypothetical protein Tco_1564107, partial [Tanacetum coccineum]